VRNRARATFLRALLIGLLAVGGLVIPWLIVVQTYASRILAAGEVPPHPVGIVFGAGLRRDGRPSPILADRVRTAVELYRSGKIRTLLLSGSASPGYDEPEAMRRLALELGVPDEHLLVDRGGSRTFETCRRAKMEFGVQHAILISQRFHLPRALAICQGLQIRALGVYADRHSDQGATRRSWQLREIPATLIAYLDLALSRREDTRAPGHLHEIILQKGPGNGS
jgi:SanA protein